MKAKFILIATITFVTLTTYSQNTSQNMNNLVYSKTLTGTYNEVFNKVEEGLKAIGFGIITEVAMHQKLKDKLGVDMPIYQILGVCSPKHAHIALQQEENIGLLLPCKVLIKQKEGNTFEIVTTNTTKLMSIIGNEKLNDVSEEVNISLKAFIEAL